MGCFAKQRVAWRASTNVDDKFTKFDGPPFGAKFEASGPTLFTGDGIEWIPVAYATAERLAGINCNSSVLSSNHVPSVVSQLETSNIADFKTSNIPYSRMKSDTEDSLWNVPPPPPTSPPPDSEK